MKQQLPIEINNEMKSWRMGLNSFPESYINFHKTLAEDALKVLENKGIKVYNTYMESDGWGDGMKTLHAIIEEDNDLFKIKWKDSNQEFFKISKSGGCYPLRLA